jgi:hypothetical protein
VLRTVRVTRYVTPLREGGSLPAIVEGGDDGLYVLKFRGAGQGPLALVAELISGEIGRLLQLRVPELVFMELGDCIGRNEPDPEIRELLLKSEGLNLGLDYLPGATMFDAAARDIVDSTTASKAVWFDAFITNIDRTARNTNLLWWHKQLYFIDHGASLYFQHDWRDIYMAAVKPFPAIKDHVLLPWASEIAEVDPELRSKLDDSAVRQITSAIPQEWLVETDGPTIGGYSDYLQTRLSSSHFVEDAVRAHAQLL